MKPKQDDPLRVPRAFVLILLGLGFTIGCINMVLMVLLRVTE